MEIKNKKILSVPAFFTVAQAAVILNVSEKTIRRFLARGILHSSAATRKKLIPCRDIDTFFDRTKEVNYE